MGDIIGGQRPMGTLLGARGRKVGSIHESIIGGQRPKSGVQSSGHYKG